MKEIEVKILEINKNKVVEKLEKLGAKKISEGKQECILFDFENNQLAKQGKLLRLRKNGDAIEFTFKQNISKEKAKIKEEYEVHVDNYDETIKILKNIGLIEAKKYSKYRISYTLDNTRFEIDTYPGIPTFLEVESPNLDSLKEMVKKLGFSMKDTKPWSGKDVCEYYGGKWT